MPTAAKLVSAIMMVAVALLAGMDFQAQDTEILPDELTVPFYLPIMALLGVWHGWFSMGRNLSRGWVQAVNTGVRVAFQIGFFAIVIFGLYEMFDRSTNLEYRSPGEAVIAAINLFIEYGLEVLKSVTTLAILFGGGIIAALIAEFIDRRWS